MFERKYLQKETLKTLQKCLTADRLPKNCLSVSCGRSSAEFGFFLSAICKHVVSGLVMRFDGNNKNKTSSGLHVSGICLEVFHTKKCTIVNTEYA